MRSLHTPTRKRDETREEYDSRLAASKRIQAEQEMDQWAEAHRTRKDLEEDTEVEQLQQEKENNETMKKRTHNTDHSKQMDSSAIREREAARHRATRRREHYNSWLSSQLILDSICANNM